QLLPLADPLVLSSTEERGLDARWDSKLLIESVREKLPFQDQPLFAARLGPLTASRRLFVSSGPFSSELAEIKVADRPRLVRFHTKVTLPDYLGQTPVIEERTDGNLTVPWGSRIQLSVSADQPIVSGRILLGPERSVLGMTVKSPLQAEVELQAS